MPSGRNGQRRVVLDTNVLVSATFWRGDSYFVVKMLDEDSGFSSVLSPHILHEYWKTLASESIVGKTEDLAVQRIVSRLVHMSLLVFPTEIPDIAADPDDNNILACAIAGAAGTIVTQDKHLLVLETHEGIRILTPAQFLRAHSGSSR